MLENRGTNTFELEAEPLATRREDRETAPHPGREQHHKSISKEIKMNVSCVSLICAFKRFLFFLTKEFNRLSLFILMYSHTFVSLMSLCVSGQDLLWERTMV